jgi:hypothetical protein
MDRRFALSGLAIVSSALVASHAVGQSSASTAMGDAENSMSQIPPRSERSRLQPAEWR